MFIKFLVTFPISLALTIKHTKEKGVGNYMNILFSTPCGDYEGKLREIQINNKPIWFLVTKSDEHYRFIGVEILLESYAKYTQSAIIYGHCHVSSHGQISLEVIEVKSVYRFELKLLAHNGYDFIFQEPDYISL